MNSALRLLLVEDSLEDAELILMHLRSHGIAFTSFQVDSMEGFAAALGTEPWDLVLSDFSLPGTDGLKILACLRERDPDLPFILLSGVLDEEAAVEAMRNGANDFLLKGNLSRLVPAIEREMKDADLRRKQRGFEEELRLLHTAMEQTPDMVVITDRDGVMLYANAAASAVTGFSRAELIGQNPRIFKSGQHEMAFYHSMWEALLSGETWRGHIVNRRKDGTPWDAEAVIAPVFSTSGDLQNYLCTARDITLERQLQGFLEQTQRLETIGTLTSGIAHDFNNILMPILGHAELGLTRAVGDPKLKHDLEIIQASTYRARDLVRQILTFSRKSEEEEAPIEVQGLLSESLKLLRATVPSSIRFEVGLDAKGAFAKVDPTKLHQIILNLCTNASHAMRGIAGKLIVQLRRERLPATDCAMNVQLEAGEYLHLEVTDTGRGIPPEHLDKVFLPFFTTKPPREGTGLGLSVTHGIVCAAGGGIKVTSQPGAGASFSVYLPLSVKASDQPSPSEDGSVRGQGHILLVDDESALVEAVCANLIQMGFEVSPFTDPELALRTFAAHPRAFQMVLTDQVMPGLSGLQLAKALWTIRPDVPIILLSGDPDMGVLTPRIEQAGFKACLTKPMSTREIAKAILRVLPELTRTPLETPR
ncbi:MAG: response regulator [Geothrix sp.]|uniref:hybrid sensor histidine kinase/response regulator n=1 Tax=Geothrix sp. TaxID=1962974 RepID=UPI0017BA27BF|nr:response regulator [Geothrix sp.]NWJ39929.1 response regulator [Geothrix sp.]WIL22059.1 MAG: response regulator [Geothrix sp.]